MRHGIYSRSIAWISGLEPYQGIFTCFDPLAKPSCCKICAPSICTHEYTLYCLGSETFDPGALRSDRCSSYNDMSGAAKFLDSAEQDGWKRGSSSLMNCRLIHSPISRWAVSLPDFAIPSDLYFHPMIFHPQPTMILRVMLRGCEGKIVMRANLGRPGWLITSLWNPNFAMTPELYRWSRGTLVVFSPREMPVCSNTILQGRA